MMAEKEEQNCCFCLSVSSGGSIIDSDILELLKFITEDLDINALENSTACDDCLNRIVAANDYKTKNSFKMIVDTNIEEIGSKCQMCDKICEQDETLQLGNCVTQIDWSDFVNYLFTDGDTKSLENSQLCDSCYVSVSNIQNFLKLLCKYDRSTIIYGDSEAKDDKNLLELKVEVKQEIENLVEDQIEIMSSHNEVDDNINCNNFECKNEVDVKVESDNDDDIHTFEKVDVKIIASNGDESCKGDYNREDEEQEVKKCLVKVEDYNSRECHKPEIKTCKVQNKKCKSNMKVRNRDIKCTFCSKEFRQQLYLDNHLLKIHQCKDTVISKIYECDKCGYATTIKDEILQHDRKHGIGDNDPVFQCQLCTYKTFNKAYIRYHMKRHNNNRDLKCALCLKGFRAKTNLDYHLVKIHNCRDNLTNKVYDCDKCSYATIRKGDMVEHSRKHGITETLQILKCLQCSYESSNKRHLTIHLKKHNPSLKCTLCSKEYRIKTELDDHLIKIHNCRDNITSKVHECDNCNYATTNKTLMLQHNNLMHRIKDYSRLLKCKQCTYETYKKTNFSSHMKSHNNIRDFKCNLCLKEFICKPNLDHHLLTTHNSRDNVTSKIYECGKCSYATTKKRGMLQHNIKHGIKDNSLIFKCQQCTYETYSKSHFSVHVKSHNNVRAFTCALCSKEFAVKINLDDHLLKFHGCRDNITSKVYDCDKCSFSTTRKEQMLPHNRKHDMKDTFPIVQ